MITNKKNSNLLALIMLILDTHLTFKIWLVCSGWGTNTTNYRPV